MPSKTFTLDGLRERLEEKYGPVTMEFARPDGVVDKVTFVQAIRLSKDARKALMALQKQRTLDMERREAEEKLAKEQGRPAPERDSEADEAETITYLHAMLRLAADDSDKAGLFFAAIGDDILLLTEVVKAWMESSDLGEASPSES